VKPLDSEDKMYSTPTNAMGFPAGRDADSSDDGKRLLVEARRIRKVDSGDKQQKIVNFGGPQKEEEGEAWQQGQFN
jgi:hypothetical protein